MTELRTEVAREIMALVDENPSEPFSYERKVLEEKIEDLFARFTQQADDELDASFDLGVDEGRGQGEEEAEDTIQELETRIEELETELEQLETSIADRLDKAYEEGVTAGQEILS